MGTYSSRLVLLTCVSVVALVGPGSSQSQAQAPGGARARAADPKAIAVQPAAAQPAARSTLAIAAAKVPANALARTEAIAHLEGDACIQAPHVMSLTWTFDNTPLERPRALAVVAGDRSAVLGKIAGVLRDQGFTETVRDMEVGELRATRTNAAAPNARDDVLIWADGQAGDATRVKIYFDYGYYQKLKFGDEAQRMFVTADEVTQHVGGVRQAILNLTGAN